MQIGLHHRIPLHRAMPSKAERATLPRWGNVARFEALYEAACFKLEFDKIPDALGLINEAILQYRKNPEPPLSEDASNEALLGYVRTLTQVFAAYSILLIDYRWNNGHLLRHIPNALPEPDLHIGINDVGLNLGLARMEARQRKQGGRMSAFEFEAFDEAHLDSEIPIQQFAEFIRPTIN